LKQIIKVGVVCLARNTFDYKAAEEIYRNIQQDLKSIDSINWEIVSNLIFELEDSIMAAHDLLAKEIDALVCISGTFALGYLVLELSKIIKRPILLWGLEELPYDGGKIRLNSVCGINLNASNLYKAGIKNYHVVIGDKIDTNWLDAIRIEKVFSASRIGLIGYRAKGFVNLDVDELDLYKQVGVLIEHFELSAIFNFEINDEKKIDRIKQIESIFDISQLNKDQLGKVAELIVKIDEFIKKNNFTALAIRCWPEFASDFGISPCAAMSILQSEGKVIACEGDVLGSLSMLAHQAIGGEFPFLADFSQVNFEEDFGLLWHCGVAPCNLWDGKCIRSLDPYFAAGKGVTADFVMKEGVVSLLRFDYAPEEYRIFAQKAQAIPMEKELKGTYVKVKFQENVKKVLEKIIDNGIAHHISVVYGDFTKVFEIFAKIKGWKLIS
jgi:L-fucose isomerase-like protein